MYTYIACIRDFSNYIALERIVV